MNKHFSQSRIKESYRPQAIHHRSLPLLVTAMACVTATSLADDAPAPSRVNALINTEFSDKYLTPRGMIVHDEGLTFQVLALGLFNVYKGDSFLTDVTLVGGIWNDFTSESKAINSPPKQSWVEIDPIAGVSFGFAKHLKLDVTYTSFNMQISNIPYSHHLETKLSLDDSSWLGAFALHPYFLFWQELDGKATAAQVPYLVDPLGKGPQTLPDSSYYLELGVAPSYTFTDLGLKLEAPCRVLLPNKDFYGEYYDKSSTVGLYEVGLKASIPLKFMPPGYGNWGAHIGFRYMAFEDKNLQEMQVFNAPREATKDTTQVYAGVSVFF